MEIGEILEECRRKQRASGRTNVGVYLTLSGRRLTDYQNKIRLFGPAGGPLGEILNVLEDGTVVAIFPADKVINGIRRQLQIMVNEDPESAWKALLDTLEHTA